MLNNKIKRFLTKGIPTLLLATLIFLSQMAEVNAASAITYASGSNGTGSSDLYPSVSITNSVAWTDKANGEAEVTINVSETPEAAIGQTRQSDIVLALDRSASMVLNSYYLETTSHGFSKTTLINSGNSPCLNDNHYYSANGRKCTIVVSNSLVKYNGAWCNTTWSYDMRSNSTTGVKLWDIHYNKNDKNIKVNYSNQCTDKFELSKNVLTDYLSDLKTKALTNPDLLKSNVYYFGFSDGHTTIDGGKTKTVSTTYGDYMQVSVQDLVNGSSVISNAITKTSYYPSSTYTPMFSQVNKIGTNTIGEQANLKLIIPCDGAVSDSSDATTARKAMIKNLKTKNGKGLLISIIAMGVYEKTGTKAIGYGGYDTSIDNGDKVYNENETTVKNEAASMVAASTLLHKYTYDSRINDGAGGTSDAQYASISSADNYTSVQNSLLSKLNDITNMAYNTTVHISTYVKTVSAKINTGCWDFVGVTYSSIGTSNYTNNELQWTIPEYTGATTDTCNYQLKFKIKLNNYGKYVSVNDTIRNVTTTPISISYYTKCNSEIGASYNNRYVSFGSNAILGLLWDTSAVTVKEATTTPNGIVFSGTAGTYYKPSSSVNSYYVNGNTNFNLSFTGYTRFPTSTYQVNKNIYNVYKSSALVQQMTLGSVSQSAALSTNTFSNTTYLSKVSTSASRLSEYLDGASRNTGYQTTITTKMSTDKLDLSIYGVSIAYVGAYESDVYNSSATSGTSYTNTKIQVICDDKDPTIIETSLYDNQTITSSRNYTVTGSDDGSGMRSITTSYFKKATQEWVTLNAGVSSSTFTVDFTNPNMLGNIQYRAVAIDNVGNVTTHYYSIFASNMSLSQTTITGNENFTNVAKPYTVLSTYRDNMADYANGNVYYVNEGSRFTLNSKATTIYADSLYNVIYNAQIIKKKNTTENEGVVLNPSTYEAGNVDVNNSYLTYQGNKNETPFTLLTPLTSTWAISADLKSSTAHFMGTASGDGEIYTVYSQALMNTPYTNVDYALTTNTYQATDDRITISDIYTTPNNLSNSITILPDGTAPEVVASEGVTDGGTKILNRPTTIKIAAVDLLSENGTGSGISSIKISAYNEQLDESRDLYEETEEHAATDYATFNYMGYSLDYNLVVNCPYGDSAGDNFWLGDIDVTVQAIDRVGNTKEFTFKLTVFTLEASIERVYPDDTRAIDSFLIGEAGWVNLQTGGYVDTIEVEFPDGFTTIYYNMEANVNNDLNQPTANDDVNNQYYYYLNRTFESTYGPHYRTPIVRDYFSHGFIVPQYYDDETYGRVVTVLTRAWKGQYYIEVPVTLYITDPDAGQSPTDNELLGHLRTKVLN